MHANDRLEALLSGTTEAAALMEPLVSRALAAGARKIADLRWRGGIVAGDDVDDDTAAKLRRALNRAIDWLRQNEERSRARAAARPYAATAQRRADAGTGGRHAYQPEEFKEKVDWMVDRGFLKEAPKYADVVRSK